MHDTKLHMEPEEFVFVRRSRPLTEYDFKEYFLNEDPNMRFRFFDPTYNRSPRLREIHQEHEPKQRTDK